MNFHLSCFPYPDEKSPEAVNQGYGLKGLERFIYGGIPCLKLTSGAKCGKSTTNGCKRITSIFAPKKLYAINKRINQGISFPLSL
jgi:hypothetical protein